MRLFFEIVLILIVLGFIHLELRFDARVERHLEEFNRNEVKWAQDAPFVCDKLGIPLEELPSNRD